MLIYGGGERGRVLFLLFVVVFAGVVVGTEGVSVGGKIAVVLLLVLRV